MPDGDDGSTGTTSAPANQSRSYAVATTKALKNDGSYGVIVGPYLPRLAALMVGEVEGL